MRAGLLADCLMLMRLVDAGPGRPVGQLREPWSSGQRVRAAIDAASPERGVHRVAGRITPVDQDVGARDHRAVDRRAARARSTPSS